MKQYAVLEGNLVVNVIIADSVETAEKLTASTCIFVTEATGSPYIGLSYADGVFEQPPTPALPEDTAV
jgi:hypothetical protein